MKQQSGREEAPIVGAAPHRNGAPVSTRVFASVGCAGGREPPGVVSPAFDAAPSPDRGSAELAERFGEARTRREDVHTLRRDAEPLCHVHRDHEFGLAIDPHARRVPSGLSRINILAPRPADEWRPPWQWPLG